MPTTPSSRPSTLPPADGAPLLTALHGAAVAGVAPYPRAHDAVASWARARSAAGRAATRRPRADAANAVHVFALGKAAPALAAGALDALADAGCPVAGGVVVSAHRPAADALRTDGGRVADTLPFHVGDHPVPDIGSLAAADAIARAVSQVAAGEDVLVLVSGGTTALCAAPCAELVARVGHPADAQVALAELAGDLLARGLTIADLNAFRRPFLRWGAGRLAVALAARGAREVATFALSDVPGDEPAVIGSGPCTPDPFDADERLARIDALQARDAFTAPFDRMLGLTGVDADAFAPPAAAHRAFAAVRWALLGSNADARAAAAEAARAAGVRHVLVADAPLVGDATALGEQLVQAALRVAAHTPDAAVLVWGGEPTVDLMHPELDDAPVPADDRDPPPVSLSVSMRGGRMQQLALAAALALEHALLLGGGDARRVTLLAAGTDGRDGPTDAAGAVIDAASPLLARRGGADPQRALRRFDAYGALDAAGALLRTGPTGTNVTDLVLVHVRAEPPAP